MTTMTSAQQRIAIDIAEAEIRAGQADRDAANRLVRSADTRINAARSARARAAAATVVEQHDGLGPETHPIRVAPVTCEVPHCSNVATSHGATPLCIEHAAEFAAWREQTLSRGAAL